MLDRCVCGYDRYSEVSRPAYEVDDAGVTRAAGKELSLAQCKKCGVIRQLNVSFKDEDSYVKYYSEEYPPVKGTYGAKNYAHDLKLAVIRCSDYGIRPGWRGEILDVGCGSGALIEHTRSIGIESYGCELAKYHYSNEEVHQYIYYRRFEDIHFPTDKFDKVLCHDVLEHVLNPITFIDELFRVTKQRGDCIVDFPNYFSESGKHHWKDIEHVWFFNFEQLKKLLKKAGFEVSKITRPIESKLVFYLYKPEQIRPAILVPPGIGDSYWSIVKMQSFLEREKLGLPDVSVVCPRSKLNDGHKRSFPFLEMFPFLNSTGVAIEGKQPGGNPIWKEAYMERGRTIFKNVAGFDYFIAYNGHMRFGERLEDINQDLRCNWFPDMFVSLEQEDYKKTALNLYGRYIVFYFVFQGTYCYWSNQFPTTEVANFVTMLADRSGCKAVFVGAHWDASEKKLLSVITNVHKCVNLTGRTTVEQLFGLLRGAQLVVGYPSGLTIMSAVLRQKTIIIWNDYYNRDFMANACPPETLNKNYWMENTKGLTAEYLADFAMSKITGEEVKVVRKELLDQTECVDLMSTDSKKLLVPKSLVGNDVVKMKKMDKPYKKETKRSNSKFAVVCVLKTGGDFDERYVLNLRNMVIRNSTREFEFICATNSNKLKDVKAVKLSNDLPGWWSKIELFKSGLIEADRIIYFDLDTLILQNIDDVFDLNEGFYGLMPWNKVNREKGLLASGMMSWDNGGFDFIFSQFSRKMIGETRTDQEYITLALKTNNVKFKFLQSSVRGIYSYKKNCRSVLPNDARIICFHGRPRIHELRGGWVEKVWNEDSK